MKILNISLKNLNSLRGEWHIDLSDKAYTDNGIFAVTGPTGAGKTTIFDAVCLALYGQTPRLGKITNSSNEIMSKHTRDSYAKIVFEGKGKKYISSWQQHKSSTGKLQDAKHTLSEADSGEIISEGLKHVPNAVENLTGMDFKRFIRAMMLEQGGFDEFLNAGKNEKAEILELITGTDIYSEISKMVFARSKEEAQRLGEKNTRLETLKSTCEGHNEEAIVSGIEQYNSELARLIREHEATEITRDLLREIHNLQIELVQTDSDIARQQKLIDDFQAKRIILETAPRASELKADYAGLSGKREARIKAEKECQILNDNISQNEAKLSGLRAGISETTAELLRIRHGITDSPEVFVQKADSAVDDYELITRELNDALQKLNESQAELDRAVKSERKMREAGAAARARMNEADKNHKSAFDEIMSMRARTAEAVFDEARAKLKPGIPCPVCGSLEHPRTEHDDSVTEESAAMFRRLEKLEAELDKLRTAAESASQNFDSAVTNWTNANNAMTEAKTKCEQISSEIEDKKEKQRAYKQRVSEAINSIGLSNIKTPQEVRIVVKKWADKVSGFEEKIQADERDTALLEADISTRKENLAAKRQELDALIAELDKLEAVFSTSLSVNGFAGEKEFTEALKFVEELPALRERWQELTNSMNTMISRRQITAAKLEEKSAHNTSTAKLDDIESLYKQQTDIIMTVNGKKSALTQQLENLRESLAKIAELERERDLQKAITERWSALNDLIGSANGDKFRVFAQRITLGLVVKNANDYLRKMNGRYTLIITNDSDKLELSVIDRDQGGIERPTENLSGGERFIVSLALALGLSQISGSKVRVDSLFLDEGFGSLDEDSLNTALEALGEVKREGRMIGIISHVAALRERIAAQIRVIPKREGVSEIMGPGCTKGE